MIDKKQIEYIGELSRIKIEPKEIDELQKDLSGILDYVNKLQEVDTKKVELMNKLNHLKNVTRSDETRDSKDKKDIIENFPEKSDNFLKVKPIF